jgi:tryptophanyl-tRNA synthetase
MNQPFTIQDNAAEHILRAPVTGQRVLSGVQPSGVLHWGNYFGALRNFLRAQDENDTFIFIADLHALTTVRNGCDLRQASFDVALDYLALGLDPAKVTLYRQSDLPMIPLLSWIFHCLTPVGDLERGVAFKDKVAKGLSSNAGLLCYPVLQAADILSVNADVVPVGADQLQNIELARSTASRFNEAFGVDLFKAPKAQVSESQVVPGLDGQKMSKSYNNTVPIFASPAEYARRVATIKTDSLPAHAPRDPDNCTLYALMKLVACDDEMHELRQKYVHGGLRHGALKQRLTQLMADHFAPAMARREALKARPWDVEDVLRAGAHRAAGACTPVMKQVLELVGLRSGLLEGLPGYGKTFGQRGEEHLGWG